MGHPGKPATEIKLKVLSKLGAGTPKKVRGPGMYEVDGQVIHARFCGVIKGRPDRYGFNINPTSLKAPWELWVCGDSAIWYLLPHAEVRRIYDDPDAYVASAMPKHRVVSLETRGNMLAVARGGKKLDISGYRNAVLRPIHSPTVGQPLAYNPSGWRGPALRRESGATWVSAEGWSCEDWNFALDRKRETDGWVYGFGEGKLPAERRRRSATFNVVFYYRDQDGAFRLAGVYRDAEYLDGPNSEAAWKTMLEEGEVARRGDDLRKVFGTRKQEGERATRVLEEDEPVRWRVRADHVLLFEDHPRFSPPGKQPWRHRNAHDWGDLDWTELIIESPDEDTDHEGRLSMVLHRQRERSSRIKKAVKARKAQLAAEGRLHCEACTFDFAARFRVEVECLEGHHTRPLGDLPPEGAEISADEICLLCPTCHRVAHRTGKVQLADLKKLLRSSRP
jgi:hypothetical protein